MTKQTEGRAGYRSRETTLPEQTMKRKAGILLGKWMLRARASGFLLRVGRVFGKQQTAIGEERLAQVLMSRVIF
jgi:hypothetical protein